MHIIFTLLAMRAAARRQLVRLSALRSPRSCGGRKGRGAARALVLPGGDAWWVEMRKSIVRRTSLPFRAACV
jgi:hypothetical protein